MNPRLDSIVAAQSFPLLFVTISAAHLYRFPSPDSDFDLRGARERLRGELQAAHEASRLPAVPPEETEAALNNLLVRVRLVHGPLSGLK